jgi:hypothetical protein
VVNKLEIRWAEKVVFGGAAKIDKNCNYNLSFFIEIKSGVKKNHALVVKEI